MAPIKTVTTTEYIHSMIENGAKASSRLPTFFIPHGSPMLIYNGELEHPFSMGGPQGPLGQFLDRFGPALLRHYGDSIKAIVMFSAHWESSPSALKVMSVDGKNEIMYDFRGFDPELYKVKWYSKGSKTVATRVVSLLKEAGISAEIAQDQPLDHGSWVPFMKMFPNKPNNEPFEIPVLQASIDTRLDMSYHLAIGRALEKLRDEGVLIIGSGYGIHNLRRLTDLFEEKTSAPEFPLWEKTLVDIVTNSTGKERSDKLEALKSHPNLKLIHPRIEHLIPLYVAAGAGEQDTAKVMCLDYGCVSFGFGL